MNAGTDEAWIGCDPADSPTRRRIMRKRVDGPKQDPSISGAITPDPYHEDGQRDAIATIMADGWYDEVHMFGRYFRGDRSMVLDWDGDEYRVGLYEHGMDNLVAMTSSNDLHVVLAIARATATMLQPEYTAADLATLRKYRAVEKAPAEVDAVDSNTMIDAALTVLNRVGGRPVCSHCNEPLLWAERSWQCPNA